MTTATSYPSVLDTEKDVIMRRRSRKLREFFKSLFSHTLINFVGLFFLVPFLWMLVTSFKSSEDIFHTPPRWLPYDNLRVEVNGQQLPVYNVKTPDGIKQLAALKIAEGKGMFVDPADPTQPVEYELQVGTEKIAEPVMHISFRWQNFPDAMNRGSRSDESRASPSTRREFHKPPRGREW